MMRYPLHMRILQIGMLLGYLLIPTTHASPEDHRIAIIVSAQENWNGTDMKVNRRQLARIYRKQITLDRHGHRLHPVNLSATHLLRRQLSGALFKRTPLEMANYWNERYFQGVSPPHVVNSQEAMIRFISSTPGAIGYVAPCMLDKRVKVLMTIKLKEKISKQLCH